MTQFLLEEALAVLVTEASRAGEVASEEERELQAAVAELKAEAFAALEGR